MKCGKNKPILRVFFNMYRKSFMLNQAYQLFEEIPWRNAQIVEKKLKMQRKPGRWLENQIKKEIEHS